jgi:hypothetical protein
MPTPIEIPRTASAPVDPDAPSLVTTLSVDIRLLIFEVLLKRDGPFLLHNADLYHAQEPGADKMHSDQRDADRTIKSFHNQYFDELGGDHEFVHAYDMGIAVLLSCRQIYHEGAAILYSANEFIISRATDRHDEDGYDRLHYYYEYHPFNYADEWLSGIGSQHSLLKKVILDTDSVCPEECENRLEVFDILPLARFIWTHQGTEHKIRFGQSGRPLQQHTGEMCEISYADVECQKRVQNLNCILSEIVAKDSLDLKRFTFSTRILQSVNVSTYSRLGCVHYRNAPFYARRFEQTGDNTDTGFELSERAPVPGLSELMRITKGKLMNHCLSQSDIVMFDLNKVVVRGINLSLFQINRKIRHQICSSFCSYDHGKDVLINLTSHDLTTDFGAFSSLDKVGIVSRNADQAPICDFITVNRTGKARTCIVLNLEVSTPSTLNMARIEIRGFCGRSLQLLGTDEVLIRFILTYPCGRRLHTEERSILLSDLHRRIFLLLSDVMIDSRYDEDYIHDDLPSIWINGHGDLIRASFPADDSLDEVSIDYAYGRFNRDEVNHAGYKLIARWGDYVEKSEMQISDRTPLMDMWSCLVSRYWWAHRSRYERKQ